MSVCLVYTLILEKCQEVVENALLEGRFLATMVAINSVSYRLCLQRVQISLEAEKFLIMQKQKKMCILQKCAFRCMRWIVEDPTSARATV